MSLEFTRHLIDLDGKFFLNETALLLLGLIEAIRLHLFINFIYWNLSDREMKGTTFSILQWVVLGMRMKSYKFFFMY